MTSTSPKKQIQDAANNDDLQNEFSQLNIDNPNKAASKKPKLMNPIKMLCPGEQNCDILLKIVRIERRQLQFGHICIVIGTDGHDFVQIEGYGKYAERLTSWIKQSDIGKISYLDHAEVKLVKPEHNNGSVPYVLRLREDTTVTLMKSDFENPYAEDSVAS